MDDASAKRTYTHFRAEPVEIGEYTYVSEWCHISQYTWIGRYCSIANLCTLGAHSHPMNELTTYPVADFSMKKTIIGHDVWIGSSVVVLAGVTVGTGAVIGAGSIVTKDVPPYAIVVGNPAAVIKYRFDAKTIAALLESRWWERSIDEVAKLPLRDVWGCLNRLQSAQLDRLTRVSEAV